MYDHLILISRERVIGTDTSNLIYTEIKIRTKKYDGAYLQSKDYEHLVERELNDAQIANFKTNIHLYKKVRQNKYGTIYQRGRDFNELYWSLFPRVEDITDEKKAMKTT